MSPPRFELTPEGRVFIRCPVGARIWLTTQEAVELVRGLGAALTEAGLMAPPPRRSTPGPKGLGELRVLGALARAGRPAKATDLIGPGEPIARRTAQRALARFAARGWATAASPAAMTGPRAVKLYAITPAGVAAWEARP